MKHDTVPPPPEPDNWNRALRVSAGFEPRDRFFFLGGMAVGLLHYISAIAPEHHREPLRAIAHQLNELIAP